MNKLDYIRRDVRITDYNALVDAINRLIDKFESRNEIEYIEISRVVKDYKFFNNEETKLPYNSSYTIVTAEDAASVFEKYLFTYKEMKQINEAIRLWKIVSLVINVKEESSSNDDIEVSTADIIEPTITLYTTNDISPVITRGIKKSKKWKKEKQNLKDNKSNGKTSNKWWKKKNSRA